LRYKIIASVVSFEALKPIFFRHAYLQFCRIFIAWNQNKLYSLMPGSQSLEFKVQVQGSKFKVQFEVRGLKFVG